MKRQMKYFSSSLFCTLACVVCCLCLNVVLTSCSDDDDDKDKTDEQEQSSMPAGVSDDATVLGSLLSSWVEDFGDAVNSSILSKQYEATVGEADEVQQTVRSMVVGTQEQADAYARQVLGVLGASRTNLDGFSWSNSSIGTVSYKRGSTGSNELGVIDVAVRQLPGLTKLRLLKDFEGNAPATAYYQKGDIVKYTGSGKNKDRYFLCLNNHQGGAQATWISFDCGEQVNSLKGGTCSWMTVGDDIYHDNENADFEALEWWLSDFVLSDDGYKSVRAHLTTQPLTVVNQIVPSSQELRMNFLRRLLRMSGNVILDVNKPINNEDFLRADKMKYSDERKSTSKVVRTYYPTGLLLYGPLRWSMHMLTWDYWVPNLVLVDPSDVVAFTKLLDATASQSNDKSHFAWSNDGELHYGDQKYYVFRVGMHWTHEAYTKQLIKYSHLLDFTKNVRNLDNQLVNLNNEADLDWTLHNVTSHVLKVTDNGQKYKYFETVYRAKDGNLNPQPADDGKVKAGYLLCSNGKCYKNKVAAQAAKATPVAMVVHVGAAGSVETDAEYNALAVALKDCSYSNNDGEIFSQFKWCNNDGSNISCVTSASTENATTVLNGIAMTEQLKDMAHSGHGHQMVSALPADKAVNLDGYSQWFIGSIGQWLLAMKGMGYPDYDKNVELPGNGHWLWSEAGVPEALLGGFYLTMSEGSNGAMAWLLYANKEGEISIVDSLMLKTTQGHVRPFVAFTLNQ